MIQQGAGALQHTDGTQMEQGHTVAELERELAAVKQERDELHRDVEQLCMSRGSSMFSSSYVISEKMLSMEKEIKYLRSQLRAATSSRDDLAENIQQLRAAKRQSDVGWQADRERCATLERELAFYQNSSAKAMSDRDKVQFEADELRQQVASLESSLHAAEGRAGAERFQKEELAKQLQTTRLQLEATTSELRARIKECGQLPELRGSLARTQGMLQELTAAHSDLKDKLQSTQQGLEQARSKLQQVLHEAAGLKEQLSTDRAAASKAQEAAALQAARMREQQAALQKQTNEQSARIREQDTLFEQTHAALITAQAGVKELQASKQRDVEVMRKQGAATASQLQAEVASLQDKLSRAEAFLSRTTIERNAAQQALEQTRTTAAEDAAAVDTLTQRNNELKVRLAVATQEKVDALLKAAQGTAESVHHSSRTTSATSSPLEDGLHSSSVEHDWDVPRSAGSDDLDAGKRHRVLEEQVQELEERFANIGRLLPLAHRYRAALQALSPRPTGAAGGKAAQDAQAELNRLAEECRALRQKLGLGGAAAEQEDLELCQQQPAITEEPQQPAPTKGAAVSAKKGAVAAMFAAVQAITAKGDATTKADAGDADSTGTGAALNLIAAAQPTGKAGSRSLNALPGRLDRALAREIMELVSFGIGSLKHVNEMMAYNSLMDF